MAKVFRLHKGEDRAGWFTSKIFNDEDLKTIETSGKEVSNSIPSPFARIDLVKEAFRWVSRNGIEGNSAHHKHVSEALDVGQLMFYSNKHKDEIDIIEYDPRRRISDNFSERDLKHKDLATTLSVYWEEDGSNYNFQDTERIYFILYNKELIGSTSPASVFMAAPITDRLKNEIALHRASGKYFDKIPVSLVEREWDFIEYLFLLAKQENFASLFPEVFEYLEKVKEVFDSDRRRKINDLSAQSLSGYERCFVTGEADNYCNVAGLQLYLARERVLDIESSSDFVIDSDHPVEGHKPLVLPAGTFSENWIYTTSDVIWNPNEHNGKIPKLNPDPLTDSRLPVTGDVYPWLSVDNFLEDKIIELPYEIDSTKFVTGNTKKNRRYLLPLTETFFKYFHADKVADMLSIEEYEHGGTVIVKLDIKTRGGQLRFEKSYRRESKIPLELHLSILPFIKVPDAVPIKYNIGIIDAEITNNERKKIRSSLYYNGKIVDSSEPVIRSSGVQNTIKSFYINTKQSFDSVKISYEDTVSGYLIPRMNEYRPGYEKCKFAVDFGTTNTHIEYKVGNNAEKALDNISAQPFYATLLDRSKNVDPIYLLNEELFEAELFPYTFGENNNICKFPLRTAMVENNIDFNKPVEIYNHLNNYLLYEKRKEPEYLKLTTTLKWENLNDHKNRVRLESYLENLTWLIYYKALSLQVDFSSIEIVWFYPISMNKYQIQLMKAEWKKNLENIFGIKPNDKNIQSIPESIGPYIYYYKVKAITGQSVSVDIGGGSTDISVYDQNETKVISSIRFAGDAIFGDGFGRNPNKNGFVNLARTKAESYLKSNDPNNTILKNILEERRMSNDFSSYLFSLSETSSYTFDYPAIIKNDPHVKFVILLFHGAIAYYIGNMLKGANFQNPKQILFSGTASKTVSFLNPDSSLQSIADFYGFIINQINPDSVGSLKSMISDIPKEITCKGGLLSENVNYDAYKQIYWFGGSEKWDKNIDLSQNLNIPKYDEQEDFKESIRSSILNFYDVFDRYLENTDLENEFGIGNKALKLFKATRGHEIIDDLERGMLQMKRGQSENNDGRVEQSLFFYPLIGEINRLAFELSKL